MKGNCSFPFIQWGHLCLLPLVTGLLTLVAEKCLPLFGTHDFMRLTAVVEWGFVNSPPVSLLGFGLSSLYQIPFYRQLSLIPISYDYRKLG